MNEQGLQVYNYAISQLKRYQIENYCSGILGKGIPGTMCCESPGGRGGTWEEEKEEEGWRWSGAKECGSRSGVAN